MRIDPKETDNITKKSNIQDATNTGTNTITVTATTGTTELTAPGRRRNLEQNDVIVKQKIKIPQQRPLKV
jgi:heptaprenylglyceryl phosphate synthase